MDWKLKQGRLLPGIAGQISNAGGTPHPESLTGNAAHDIGRHSGMVRSTRPGISRFSDVQLHIVVRCFASPRNDGLRGLVLLAGSRDPLARTRWPRLEE